MTITLFSTGPSCHKCRFSRSQMEKKGLDFAYVDLNDEGAELPEAIQTLVDSGQWTRIAPFVVVTDDSGEVLVEQSWNDARPDKIMALAAQLRAVAA